MGATLTKGYGPFIGLDSIIEDVITDVLTTPLGKELQVNDFGANVSIGCTGDLVLNEDTHFGSSGAGRDVTFYTDTAGVGMRWDHDAATNAPRLEMDIEPSRISYFRIKGTDTAPATMGEGVMTIDTTLTTGAAAIGMNALFFKVTDSRALSTGTNFARICRGEVVRTGTASGGTDQTFMNSMILTDSYQSSATATKLRRLFQAGGTVTVQGTAGSPVSTVSGFDTATLTNLVLQISGSAATTTNCYGLDNGMTYNELVFGGSNVGTLYGHYFHPTLTATPTNIAAVYATVSGIDLRSDYVKLTDSSGYAAFGAGRDTEIGDDGSDFVIDSDVQGAGGRLVKFAAASNWTANGTNTVTITNVAPSGVGTATISKWFTVKDNAGTTYYIPAWT